LDHLVGKRKYIVGDFDAERMRDPIGMIVENTIGSLQSLLNSQTRQTERRAWCRLVPGRGCDQSMI
jgi:hypothetical protein